MNIKKVIGVLSCKGGVGKSTISINLSTFFASFFFKKVGLLDADIQGSSHSILLGLDDKIKMNLKGKKFLPVKKYNISTMSLSYFINNSDPILLRGPMISNTINYIYNNTLWNNLDVLFIDFPPGTGDIYLSILRDIKIDGVLLITTQHLQSIEHVKKSYSMLKKFNIKVLGILENMSYHECLNCGDKKFISSFDYLNYFIDLNPSNIFRLSYDFFITKSSNNGIPFIFYNSCYKKNFIFKNMCKLFL